ncbi:MAG: PD-(D/E)XK nuclease family protein [Pseudomonadota bacterium]
MTVYSHSRLSTYENCPLQYKYKYIDRIKREEDSIEAFMGKRFHEVMEKLYAERSFRDNTAEDLKALFNDLWDRNFGEHVFVIRTDRTAEDYRRIGLDAIEKYYDRYAPFDQGKNLGIEKQLMIGLDNNQTHRVRGYLDRIVEKEDGFYEIHDYKTSGTLPLQEYLDRDRQLALYEIGLRQAWPDVKKADLVWHYVVFDKEMRSSRTAEQLEDVKKSTIALIDQIEAADKFPPKESGLCSYCAYQDICPLFAHKFRIDVLPKDEYRNEEGVDLVNRLTVIDRKKKELEAELHVLAEDQTAITEAAIQWAMKKGYDRVFGASRTLNIHDDIALDYPHSKDPYRDEFEAGLHALGIWDDLVRLNGPVFKSYAKKHSWLVEVPKPLADMVKVKATKSTRLVRRKNVDEDEEEENLVM